LKLAVLVFAVVGTSSESGAVSMRELKFTSGIEIFHQGDVSDLAYTIVSGAVEIVSDGVILATLGAGDVFGEMGLVDEAPRSATARTVGEVALEALDHDEFTEALMNRPDICLHYLRSLFERLRASNQQAAQGSPVKSPAGPPDTRQELEPATGGALLVALTPESRSALGQESIAIGRYPFKIGRRSRNPFGANDLLLEDSQPYQISRNHIAVSEVEGKLVVQDRGSFLGASVNGEAIGGKHDVKAVELVEGDNALVLGGQGSPFEFVLRVADAQA